MVSIGFNYLAPARERVRRMLIILIVAQRRLHRLTPALVTLEPSIRALQRALPATMVCLSYPEITAPGRRATARLALPAMGPRVPEQKSPAFLIITLAMLPIPIPARIPAQP